MTTVLYVIDTSSLIDMNRHYPMDLFPGVWDRLEGLVGSGRLRAPKEVLHELGQKDDRLNEWAKEQYPMFLDPTQEQINIVQDILAHYPSLIDMDRTYDADPWVIGLALELIRSPQQTLYEIRKVVVTEERIRGERVRIPLVCRHYSIESVNLFDMFRMEGWKF